MEWNPRRGFLGAPAGSAVADSISTFWSIIMISNLKVKLKQFGRGRSQSGFQGTSRRAINYFPGSALSPDTWVRLSLSNKQALLPQLINIEAEKLSGCVKMESQRFRSRSAVLIYRGRVIACVYGSKKVPQQIFGPEAYACIMSEISSVHVELTSYILQDEVVLSAASMFHGGIFNGSHSDDPVRALSNCMQFIQDLAVPGSIAVVDKGGDPVCLLYVAGGSLLGINSLNTYVKDTDIKSLWQYLQKNPESQVMANSIVTDNNSIIGLTFSLLGQSSQRSVTGESTASLGTSSGAGIVNAVGTVSYTDLAAVRAANLVSIYSIRPVERPQEVLQDRFVSFRDHNAKRMKLAAGQDNAYDIHTRK